MPGLPVQDKARPPPGLPLGSAGNIWGCWRSNPPWSAARSATVGRELSTLEAHLGRKNHTPPGRPEIGPAIMPAIVCAVPFPNNCLDIVPFDQGHNRPDHSPAVYRDGRLPQRRSPLDIPGPAEWLRWPGHGGNCVHIKNRLAKLSLCKTAHTLREYGAKCGFETMGSLCPHHASVLKTAPRLPEGALPTPAALVPHLAANSVPTGRRSQLYPIHASRAASTGPHPGQTFPPTVLPHMVSGSREIPSIFVFPRFGKRKGFCNQPQ